MRGCAGERVPRADGPIRRAAERARPPMTIKRLTRDEARPCYIWQAAMACWLPQGVWRISLARGRIATSRSGGEQAMCQQWFSSTGLVLDVVGFLLIAWEWRHMFLHSVLARENKVQEDYETTRTGRSNLAQASASMWRNTQRENQKDNRRRSMLFYTGVALVILGFVSQLLGSLPYGSSVFHFPTCS